MNPLDASPWWLLPFAFLLLLLLQAMMEFTASLLVREPPARHRPVPGSELQRRLLAAGESQLIADLVEGRDCDLEIAWASSAPSLPRRLAWAGGASHGRLRLLLDERRRELRVNEVSRSHAYFLGLAGWVPRLVGYAGAQSGPPGQQVMAELTRIAHRAGWRVRPVLWWFQATHRGFRLLDALTPPPLRRWPARRFWGLVYPLSYAAAIAYLAWALGGFDRGDFGLVVAISAAWWGVWGLLSWMLLGFPAFWRR